MRHLIADAGIYSVFRYRTHCGKSSESIDVMDTIVFEAALSDCEECSAARANALHNVRPAPQKVAVRELTRIAEEMGGYGAESHVSVASRGERALVLLKELVLLKSQGKHVGQTEFHPPEPEWIDAWRRVRELLAEDVQPTTQSNPQSPENP